MATDIGNCTNISAAGTYILTNDILDVTWAPANIGCINVSVSNVKIDGKGYRLDAATSGWAIMAKSVTNLTVTNMTLTDWTDDALDLTNVSYSTFTNLSFNHNTVQGMWLDGGSNNNISGIYSNGSDQALYFSGSDASNNTITNVYINKAAVQGIVSYGSWNYFENITINNSAYGFYVESSGHNNTLKNSLVENSATDGVYVYADDCDFNNTISRNNGNHGFYSYGYRNDFNNITASNNAQYGVYFELDSYLFNSKVQNNTVGGLYFNAMGNTATTPAKIYNNLLNNTGNVGMTGANYITFNTTNQTGTRIFSSGTNIGGNYWTNSTGTGYSDTCTDADKDGFCDSALNISNMIACSGADCANFTDYFPYSDEYSNGTVGNSTIMTPIAPINNAKNTTTRTIQFKFNATFLGGVPVNCSLWTNETSWSSKQLNQTPVYNKSIMNITYTFVGDGNYTWSISCWDQNSQNFTANRTLDISLMRNTTAIAIIFPVSITQNTENKVKANITDLMTNNTVTFGTMSINMTKADTTSLKENMTYDSSEGFWLSDYHVFDIQGAWVLTLDYFGEDLFANASNSSNIVVEVLAGGGGGGGSSVPVVNQSNQSINKTLEVYIEGFDWAAIETWLRGESSNIPNIYILAGSLLFTSYVIKRKSFLSLALIGVAVVLLVKYGR